MPPMVKRIMIVTVAVFIAQFLFQKTGMVERYFALWPYWAVRHLMLWQFVTYIFLHDTRTIFHILFNMITLYFFGPEIEQMLGRGRFLFFYLAAGVCAGIAQCLIPGNAGSNNFVVGASGAIYAVLVAYALTFPNRTVIFFIFPMKVRTLVLLLIGVSLYSGLSSSPNGVAHFAHLGGAAFGFAYWKGRPWLESAWSRLSAWRVSRKKTVDIDEEHDLDRILEKISQQGMGSLTKSERAFLLRASERRQRQKVSHEGHA